MKITRLTLKNFGVYAGTNTFEFSGQKPVVLIGGMNGRGKTTFLEAVLLALYGANSYAYTESRYASYSQYLRAYINTADQSEESGVELEFELENNPEERYLICREWSGKGQRSREKVSALKNGEYSSFLTENWSMFMENILPSGLSNFFFFDGEKISELAVESTSAQMKASIKALLGITVLDALENDIGRIAAKITKTKSGRIELHEHALLTKKKEQAEKLLQEKDQEIEELDAAINAAQKKLEHLKVEYTSMGGEIEENRQRLMDQRTLFKLKAEQYQEELLNYSAGELPLILVKDLLMQIQKQAHEEHEVRMTELAVDKILALYGVYSNTAEVNTDQVNDFISFVEHSVQRDHRSNVYNITDHGLYQLDNLLGGELGEISAGAKKIMSDRTQAQDKIHEIDSYLSVDVDENALRELYKEIKCVEQNIIDLNVKLESERNRRVSLHGEVIRATAEYNKCVEELLQQLELADDGDRILKYIQYATEILDRYKIRLQQNKIDVLSATMTECYKKLANKKNLIYEIRIDAETLDFTYLNSDRAEVPKESLSAGEKQLMVIALLWALAICSDRKLPVIIDTPLSRLDSDHRISLITTYFPQASDQTIILSTDSEIDARYYKIMKPNVGDEFTLIYDDAMKCSTIEKGYFSGKLS